MKFIADMHTHTMASDHAFSTITENSLAASQKGLKLLAMTDHCVTMEDSPHKWHFGNIDAIPRMLNGVFIVYGVEANLLGYDGSIDVDNYMYDSLDWIVASCHYPCIMPGTEKEITAAYVNALQNPRINVLGHTDSPNYKYDIKEVVKACRDCKKAMEVNVSRIKDPRKERCVSSYDFYKRMLAECAEQGAYIIVDSDAHFHSAIGEFDRAAQLIEETGFPEELVLNLDERRLKDFITLHLGKNIFEQAT